MDWVALRIDEFAPESDLASCGTKGVTVSLFRPVAEHADFYRVIRIE